MKCFTIIAYDSNHFGLLLDIIVAVAVAIDVGTYDNIHWTGRLERQTLYGTYFATFE